MLSFSRLVQLYRKFLIHITGSKLMDRVEKRILLVLKANVHGCQCPAHPLQPVNREACPYSSASRRTLSGSASTMVQ